ncbi:TetR/AcrR family transcriptional regulator [Streptomyces sp. CA-249302]|uniref:TetR/AcrR family transcriptional regulator n=1 Tax=Streptomyces sp. CA-249302 TaxID=3240058 RepID=UPI003D8DC746
MSGPIGRWGETRQRLVQVALDLFAEHGVNGTSLQMVADRVGVTKAGVYRHFKAKEDIVVAALEPVFAQMTRFLDTAAAEPDPRRRPEVALEGLVDLVIDQGHLAAVLQGDPVVRAVIAASPPFLGELDRLHAALCGPAPTPARRVAVTMVGGGLLLSGVSRQIEDIPPQQRREDLLAAARRLLVPSRADD